MPSHPRFAITPESERFAVWMGILLLGLGCYGGFTETAFHLDDLAAIVYSPLASSYGGNIKPIAGSLIVVGTGLTALLIYLYKTVFNLTIKFSIEGNSLLVHGILILCATPLVAATVNRNSVWTSAESLWLDAPQNAPLSPRPYQNLGILNLNNNDTEGAIEVLTKLTVALPNFSAGHTNLGVTNLRAHNYSAAVASLVTANNLDPSTENPLNNIYAHMDNGNPKDASALAAECIQREPKSSKCHLKLSRALNGTGDAQAAIPEAEIALTYEPNDPLVRKLKDSISEKGAAKQPTEGPESARIYATNFPPYVVISQSQTTGFFIDLVRAMTLNSGHKGALDITPWKRAQHEILQVKDSKPKLILPLIRTPERETQYKWITELYVDDSVLIHKLDAAIVESRSRLQKLDHAKGLKIGVVGGSALMAELQAGGHNIEVAPDIESCAKKLRAGRIDAWYVTKWVGQSTLKGLGATPKDFAMSPAYRRMPIYLGASLETPDAYAKALSKSFEAIKADGTYDKILKKWQSESGTN